MDPDSFMLFRGVERIAIIAAGVLLIHFGCRLFLALPAAPDAGGKLRMPSAGLTLAKLGSGVLLALFGGFLIWTIAGTAIRGEPAAPRPAPALAEAPVPAPRAQPGPAVPAPQALRFARLDIAALNCAERRLLPTLPPELRDDVARAFRRARVAMLEPVWQPAWGGPEVAQAARLGNWPPGELSEIATAQHRDC